MKFCYVDESGTGDEPYAVMVGIVIDSQRMHVTKEHWQELLNHLSKIVEHDLTEIHTRDFYSGNGVWRKMDGHLRSLFITAVFEWLSNRKHHIVFSSVNKSLYFERLKSGAIPKEVNTLWRFLGFHLMLSMQKAFQKEMKNKGNTIFIFDNEEREQKRFIDLINNCPDWSDTYYGFAKSSRRLNQVIDAPYFGDSKEVGMIQVADFVAYFLRKYIEIEEGSSSAKYAGEEEKVRDWAKLISNRSIGKNHIYPTKGRCKCASLFYDLAPNSIIKL